MNSRPVFDNHGLFGENESLVVHGFSPEIAFQTRDFHIIGVVAVCVVDAFERPLFRVSHVFVEKLDLTSTIKTLEVGFRERSEGLVVGNKECGVVERFRHVLRFVSGDFCLYGAFQMEVYGLSLF